MEDGVKDAYKTTGGHSRTIDLILTLDLLACTGSPTRSS